VLGVEHQAKVYLMRHHQKHKYLMPFIKNDLFNIYINLIEQTKIFEVEFP